jgi:hypothetical protein
MPLMVDNPLSAMRLRIGPPNSGAIYAVISQFTKIL